MGISHKLKGQPASYKAESCWLGYRQVKKGIWFNRGLNKTARGGGRKKREPKINPSESEGKGLTRNGRVVRDMDWAGEIEKIRDKWKASNSEACDGGLKWEKSCLISNSQKHTNVSIGKGGNRRLGNRGSPRNDTLWLRKGS